MTGKLIHSKSAFYPAKQPFEITIISVRVLYEHVLIITYLVNIALLLACQSHTMTDKNTHLSKLLEDEQTIT